MPRVRALVLAAALTGAAAVLAGCENFDLDKLDVFHLNEKKKLPGERKELFPGGVPGVSQGIPPEYLKGHEQDQPGAAIPTPAAQPGEQTATSEEGKTAAVAPAAQASSKTEAEPKSEPKSEPKPKPKAKAKAKPKPKRQGEPETKTAGPSAAPQPAAQPQSQPWPASPSQSQQGTSAPWPSTEQNQVTAPWPAAPAPGTFSR
jgi:hypothetical protein